MSDSLPPEDFLSLQITNDGSASIHSQEYNALYHSHHGAIQESQHVFLRAGLDYYQQKVGTGSVRILEMGFGTGLNAILSFLYCQKNALDLAYTGIENTPLPQAIIDELNYPALLHLTTEESRIFYRMHSEENFTINGKPGFHFQRWLGDQADFEVDEKFDLIYFDAFGPGTQPGLWTEQNLSRFRRFCSERAVFVTYCSKGDVRRALVSLGFRVSKIPGPPGKREMLRAELP